MLRVFTRRTLFGLASLLGIATVGQSLHLSISVADAAEPSWAEKMFDESSHDFGTVARAAETRYRFKVTNRYQHTVHIASVRTTCGCSAAKPTKNTLESGEVVYIEVTMDTRRFTRRKDSNLIVTFDAPQYEEVRIPITAYIRTDVVLDPGSVNFGAVDFGRETQRKVSVAYAGRQDWTIKGVESNNNFFAGKAVETSRSGGRVNYEILVTLTSTAPVGPLRGQLHLITDDSNSPRIPMLVEARVEADISVSPSVVSLGTLVPGRSKTVNVVVRGKKPFTIEKIECESDESGCFKIRLPKSARQIHILPLTVTAPDKPGKLTEVFTVTIVGREEPITFKALGKIAGSET